MHSNEDSAKKRTPVRTTIKSDPLLLSYPPKLVTAGGEFVSLARVRNRNRWSLAIHLVRRAAECLTRLGVYSSYHSAAFGSEQPDLRRS